MVKVAGACYLIYVWVSASGGGRQPPSRRRSGTRWPVHQALPWPVLTNATNPKGIIFMVAVLPQFMTDTRPLWTQLLVMAATTVAVDVVVMHGAAGASALRRLMRSARAMRMQNRVFGGLLMAVGAGLFFVKRGGQHA